MRLEGDYEGRSGKQIAGAQMLVATALLPSQAVFVKMIGPRAEVAANRQAFLDFCGSLRR